MANHLLDIPIKHIAPNPQQPRIVFDGVALQELAATIKKQGLIQRVLVTPDGQDRYTLLAGERRWRAAQIAGLETLPAIVRDRVDEETQAEIALIENVQRAGLSAAEESQAYESLATKYHLSNEQIAERVGKDRATIANLRSLLKLPVKVLAQVGPGEGQISQGVARTLAQVAKFKGTAKDIEHLAGQIAAGHIEPEMLEDEIDDLVNAHARLIEADWDLKWLATPVTVADGLELRDCAGCPHLVRLGGRDRYCTEQPVCCYPAKRDRYARREIERVSKATKIPVARPDENVTPLTIEWRDAARVKAWLSGKTRPDHLRLVRLIDQPAERQNALSTYQTRDILKSREVLLASTNPTALHKAEVVPVKTADETPQQKAKREAAEEQVRVERRAEKAQKRRAQHDIDWLGLNTARRVAPQLMATGPTLEWLAMYVDAHSPIGQWPALRQHVADIEQRLKITKKERDDVLKEFILLNLIGHAVTSSYEVDWHEDWEGALVKVQHVVADSADGLAAKGLGLKLPKGWNQPPVHNTESNCWHCGQFASMEKLTKRDIEEGWRVVFKGDAVQDVVCPECRQKNSKKPSAKGTH